MERTNRRQRNVDIEVNTRYYVDGNTVRKVPVEIETETTPGRKVSRKTRRNRSNALGMSRGFVVFLTAASIAATIMCVSYIQLKTEISQQTKTIANLQTSLNNLKSDNDALENSYSADVDLNEIYTIATERLGMHYPEQDQIITYSTDDSGYVRQYKSLPNGE